MGTAAGGGEAGRTACCPVDDACALISSPTCCWMSWSRSEKACVGAVVVLVPLGVSNGVVVTLAEVPGTLLEAVVDALVPGRVER